MELLDHRQRQVIAAAHPEAERVLARLLHRLDHAHQMGRGAAEAGATLGLHLVEQARAEVEAQLPGDATAGGHEREEVADAAGEVRRRVDEHTVFGPQAQRLRDVPGVAGDGAQVWQTPLGSPVVPEVNMIIACSSSRTASSRSTGTAGAASPPAARTPSTKPSASAVTTSRTGPPSGVGHASSLRQHDHVRPALAHQPVDVVLRQADVERDDDLAGQPRAEHAGEELVVLLEHERDTGAAAAGGGEQRRRDPRRPRLHVRVGVHAAARTHERLVRALGRPAAQARDGVGHQRFGGHERLEAAVRSRRTGTR